MRKARAKKPVTLGKRKGKKRSDMRWIAPDGSVFDSRFEYEVYKAGVDAKVPIRRTTKGKPDGAGSDTVSYWHPSRGGSCRACGSAEVGTSRSFTADILYSPSLQDDKSADKADSGSGSAPFYIDAKGYLRAPKRSLLRSLVKTRKDFALRLILQRDFPISKVSRISDWIRKYLKIQFAVWNGKWPTKWES
jgi:hypothetical protein